MHYAGLTTVMQLLQHWLQRLSRIQRPSQISLLLPGFEQVSFESTVRDWMQHGFESSWRNSTSTDSESDVHQLQANKCSQTKDWFDFTGQAGMPMPAPPLRIPNPPAGLPSPPTGGTPMGTPPSAKGIAAELPFAAGNQEGSVRFKPVLTPPSSIHTSLFATASAPTAACTCHFTLVSQVLPSCGMASATSLWWWPVQAS